MSARAKWMTVGTIGWIAVISGLLFGTFPGIVANAEPAAAGQLPVLNELQKLAASDAAEGDQFGSAVSVSGDWAIVGAPFDDGEQTDSGSVYLFRRDDNGTPADPNDDPWIQEAKLTAPNELFVAHFGRSVSIDGDRVVVGASRDDGPDGRPGSAHVFRRVGADWIHEAKLLAADAADGTSVGRSVSISGDWIVIGSSGAAYLFRLEGENWVEKEKLTALDPSFDGHFGSSVAVDMNQAVVGAPSSDAAYVYILGETGSIQGSRLIPLEPVTGVGFGTSVSIHGDRVIVGKPGYASQRPPGAAFVFRRDGAIWIQEAKLSAFDAAENDEFGSSVSISNDWIVIGATHRYDGGDSSGAAYLYRHCDNGTASDPSDDAWGHGAKFRASDANVGDRFGGAAFISSGHVVVGASEDDDAGRSSGSVYLFSADDLDCNGNGIPDACEDCNINGAADECDLADGTSVDCDEDGLPDECGVDCNGNRVADSCDIADGISNDENSNGVPDECDLLPLPVPDGVPKNRFVSFQLVSEGLTGAIRVKIVKLYNTDPNDLDTQACPPRPAQFSDLSLFEGQARWVGAPVSLPEVDGDDPNRFVGAALQCEPHFIDWPVAIAALDGDVLHVYGAEIVPCSRYEVQVAASSCTDMEDEACYSAPLTINTSQFADVGGYTNPYTTVNRIVDKLRGVPGMRKVDMLLRGNVPPVLSQVNMMDFAILYGAEWRYRPYTERGPEQCPARVPLCGDGILDPSEECDDGNGVGGDGCDGTCTMEDRTAVFALLPVDPAEIGAPPYQDGVRIVGNELFVPGGGIRVWLEIKLSGWDPDLDANPALDTFQVRIDSSGFNSGLTGTLAPPVIPCTLHEECRSVFGLGAICGSYATGDLVCQAGFHDFNRADSLSAPGNFVLVDTSAPDFRFGFLRGFPDTGLDDGTIHYGGTLVLDVSADAAGTFTVGFDSRQDESFMFAAPDPRHARIPIARMESARITVSKGCCFSDDCVNASPAFCLDSGGTPVALCSGDCNGNGRDDTCDVVQDISEDCNDNLIPDECEPDCNENIVSDDCDIALGTSDDCNGNSIPDDCELDCNGNNVPDDCDINERTSEDCNLDGIPDDCQPNDDCNNNTIKDICDIGAGDSVDCNANLVPDECDLADLGSLDDNSNNIPDECEQPPLANPSNLPANRFIGFVPRSQGAQTAIRVTLTKLYNIESSDLLNAVCPPRPDSLPDLPASNGQVRWVGPAASLPEDPGVDENRFAGAPLQCCPYFADWAQDLLAIDQEILYAFGAEIVPCSQYEVQVVSDTCLDLDDATCFSDPLTVLTGKWGDVSEPFGGSGQPNFTDIGEVVDKFKGLFPPLKVQGMLRGNIPPAGASVSFTDIGRVVDAFKSIAYPEVGPSACVEDCE